MNKDKKDLNCIYNLRSNRLKNISRSNKEIKENHSIIVENQSEEIVLNKKKKRKLETKSKNQSELSNNLPNQINLPSSIKDYLDRLTAQNKEIYKNPPELPPVDIVIQNESKNFPSRLKNQDLIFLDHPEFKPNKTPEEILRSGSFGGTQFRPIKSAVTNISYKSADVVAETVNPDWISNLDKTAYLTNTVQNEQVNKYKVKCGGSLGMWKSSGWISPIDPYGWFQWQCRFYQGRRSSDDARQISRQNKCAGPNGRFRSQLLNKIIASKKKVDDAAVSPVIRQTLLHWGLEPTEEILEEHKRKRIDKK